MQLHPTAEHSNSGGKWTDQELELLRTSVKKFGEDLNKLNVTLSALNAPEGDVDIEGLGESSATKRLDFDSDVDSSIL
ncbi:hypothetical protein ACOMHN_060169 [Nucella lapillus]